MSLIYPGGRARTPLSNDNFRPHSICIVLLKTFVVYLQSSYKRVQKIPISHCSHNHINVSVLYSEWAGSDTGFNNAAKLMSTLLMNIDYLSYFDIT